MTSRGNAYYGAPGLSPAAEIRLIALRELRRSLRSVKGIIIGVITLLGSFVASLVCVWWENGARESKGAMSNEAFQAMKEGVFEKATGDSHLASFLASQPLSLLIFLKITVWLAPLLIALLGFDLMSGELQHRSVRFWTIRSRRWSYFAGKMFGLWGVVALITLVLNVVAGTVAAAKGFVTVGQLFTWGVRFWLVAVLITGSWAAIVTLISSAFRTPILSLLTTFVTFFVLWLVGLIGLIARAKGALETGVETDMNWYEYLYPNSYDTLLVAPETTHVLTGVGILLGFVLVCCAAGSFLFQRRDV
jgi:ABC-type transport system involved in multi-copper enzyme maturation permease subunit